MHIKRGWCVVREQGHSKGKNRNRPIRTRKKEKARPNSTSTPTFTSDPTSHKNPDTRQERTQTRPKFCMSGFRMRNKKSDQTSLVPAAELANSKGLFNHVKKSSSLNWRQVEVWRLGIVPIDSWIVLRVSNAVLNHCVTNRVDAFYPV